MKMKVLHAALICAAVVLSQSCIVEAKGTVRVQKADGSVQVYGNASFTVVNKTLHITTNDKAGTLIITDAACSMGSNSVLMCLPYSMVLVQDGTHPLDFQRGTIYFNKSKETQMLSRSTTQLPPNGLTGLLVSTRGTYVSFSGTLDARY